MDASLQLSCSSGNTSTTSRDSIIRCYWLQHVCLMNIFSHFWKPATIACRNFSALHAITAHETRHYRQSADSWRIDVHELTDPQSTRCRRYNTRVLVNIPTHQTTSEKAHVLLSRDPTDSPRILIDNRITGRRQILHILHVILLPRDAMLARYTP